MVKIDIPLSEIRGIGPKFVERLKKLQIATVKNLLWYFPFRYEDFSQISKIADLKINSTATICGVVSDIKLHRTWKKRMFIIEALISDETGSIKAVWFNQRFLLSILKKGKTVNLAGKVIESPRGGLILSHPTYELVASHEKKATRHTGRLVPIYPETKKLTSKALRFLIKPLLDELEEIADPIPFDVLKQHNFPEINRALRQIHFPENLPQARIAKKRFAFEDLFFLQLANLRLRLRLSREKAHSFPMDAEFIKSLLAKLPFELTPSQKKSLFEILKDLEKPHPMNRLLQGDVGSGKTIVAALAALLAAKNEKQTAFMAPTEVLARQHYQTFKKFFDDFDKGIALLTSSESKVFYGDELENEIAKKKLLEKIFNDETKIIIGTHALIQKSVTFKDLALTVVDEQHRFGVKQRAKLTDQSSNILPHFLSMSATPIPRTLTLTIFGDLDLSIINELPKGRKEIITKIVAPTNRDKAYAFIRGQVKKGRQVFVICPRIEPQTQTENQFQEVRPAEINRQYLGGRNFQILELKAVKGEYEKLSQGVFPDLRVAMLHGKMPTKEKAEIMDKFSAKGGSASGGKNHEIDILVATSVIEVGVDVPNATIMMIEGAERFGLAQLYQFRGRVGRSEHQSFCFLFTDSSAKTTYRRLYSLLEAKNGFELAEKDLAIRGPGEFFGESQTGMPDLAMKAIQNPELVKASREAAINLLKTDPGLKKYPLLKKRLESFEKEVHLE